MALKPSLDPFEAPPETPSLPPPNEPAVSPPRRWWRSRYVRWTLISVALLAALLVALEPWLREEASVVMGNLCAARAQSDFYDGDLPAALAELDQAIEWSPDNPMILLFRAEMRARNNDLQGSLADYDRVIQLSPTYAGGYAGRAQIYQRLGRYPEAISDLNRAVEQQPAWEAEPRNNRAYIRALGKVELPEALADVNEAIRLAPAENANYLDTRGLILHELGQHEEALADLQRAIQLTTAQQEQWRLQAEKDQVDPRLRQLRRQEQDHALAVMHQHRSLVHAALKHTAEAQADADQAKKLGYDPSQGIE